MPHRALTSRVLAMRTTLQSIESQLASGSVPPDALEDLKAAVDDIRLRVWAIMATAGSGDPGAMQRFRLRRAKDVCQTVANDLSSGAIDSRHPEVGELREIARQFVTGAPAGTTESGFGGSPS